MSKLSERLSNVFRPDRDDNDWCLTLKPKDPLSALFESMRRSGGGHAAPASETHQETEQSADAMPDLREVAGDTRPGTGRTRGEDGRV
jgi:hypothetical protein